MSLVIIGRVGERKVIANLCGEIEIRIVRIDADVVVLDLAARSNLDINTDSPVFLKRQAD